VPQQLLRPLVVVAVVATLGVGVHLLREATQSTHYRTSPDSRLEVVVEARSNRAEPTQTLEELTLAHLSMCRLEVAADLDGGLRTLPDRTDRFAVVLAPALDSTDRKQFQGCVEDWNVDHHLVRVVSMREVGR
jgi:hypothetical protein